MVLLFLALAAVFGAAGVTVVGVPPFVDLDFGMPGTATLVLQTAVAPAGVVRLQVQLLLLGMQRQAALRRKLFVPQAAR